MQLAHTWKSDLKQQWENVNAVFAAEITDGDDPPLKLKGDQESQN
jgi:hypothetical protein